MRDEPLFVVVGAGGSYDAAQSLDEQYRPPLVSGLFDHRFDHLLDEYPMARDAAPDIRQAVAGSSGAPAVSLEDHLRTQYAGSSDDYDRRRYYSVILYLQALLWSVSTPGHGPYNADNAIQLINRLLASWGHVCFITLNYDLILDRCLAAFDPLDSLRQFIGHKRWSLIKLHGSVTWKYRMSNVSALELNNPPADLEDRIDRSQIFHDWSFDQNALRTVRHSSGQENAFPALSAPLGPDDELTCPPEHVEFLKERLAEQTSLDLLVIGYSAYDRAVLRLLTESNEKVRSLFVVGASADDGREVIDRMAQALPLDVQSERVDAYGGFGSWVSTGGLASYPEWVATRDG